MKTRLPLAADSARLARVLIIALASALGGVGQASALAAEDSAHPAAGSRYIDAEEPGTAAARVFAPGIVSIAREQGSYAERPVFTADFSECFFDLVNYKDRNCTTFHLKLQQGTWTVCDTAGFTRHNGHQPTVTADGQQLFFTTSKMEPDNIPAIWLIQRTEAGWSEPTPLDSPINSSAGASFPSVARDGTLFFLRGAGTAPKGVCLAKRVERRYPQFEAIDVLQSAGNHNFGDFCAAPDGSYIIVYATLADNLGSGDLYVTFALPNGGWSAPKNLGPAVNTPDYEFAPSISPDGRFLFFTRDQGGHGDVYWIGTAIIEQLRPESTRAPGK